MATIFGVVLIVFLILTAGLVRKAYSDNLKPLNPSDNSKIIVTIEPGSIPSDISQELKQRGVVKSDWAVEWYIRNHNYRDELKAGTYIFMPSQNVQTIVKRIVDGRIASNLVTILPGQRLDQIEKSLIKNGFAKDDVESALDPSQYKGHPALTDLPKGASLEGYLYPESFQKVKETKASEIIRKSLDEMDQHLTPEIRKAFASQGLSLHQGVILASIVEQEVSNNKDRAMVAQVFLKRLKIDMRLGSDVTAHYGAIKAGKTASVGFDSPYNTRLHDGLPPGPIGNVSASSLEAVAFPAQTDWLYFVSGDDGKTYFSKTLEEHESLTKKHCKELCK